MVAKTTHRHVCPGGYVELIEGENGIHCDDGTLTPDCALQRYFDAYLPACEKAGLKFFDGEKLKQMVEDAGFEGGFGLALYDFCHWL